MLYFGVSYSVLNFPLVFFAGSFGTVGFVSVFSFSFFSFFVWKF
jgi:hypothetical protein